MESLNSGLASATNAAPAAPAPAAAPASAPAPSSPAPAPSAPAPTNMADALRQAGYGDESPPDPTPTDAPPAPTETVPAIAALPETPPVGEAAPAAKEGPIPFTVHKTALENARTKEREAVTAEFQTQYGDALAFKQAFEADPVATVARLVQGLQSDPTYGPQLRSHAARVLGQRGPSAAPRAGGDDPEPEADLQTADGQLVYSAPQLAKREAWLMNRMERKMAEQFAPAMKVAEQQRATEALTAQTQQAMDQYRPLVEELQEMPGFAEHRAEILTRQQELFREGLRTGQRVDPMRLAFRAYREIVPAKMQAQQQQQLTASAVAKAAGREANPAAVQASPPPPPRSMAEALKQAGVY